MKHPRRILGAALALVAILAAACSDLATGSQSPNSRALTGEWLLVSINARPLPYTTMGDANGTVRVASGQLTFQAGSAFRQILGIIEISNGGGSVQRFSTTRGTYALGGARIRFRVDGGGEFEGTQLSADRIEYTVQGNYGPLVFLYERV